MGSTFSFKLNTYVNRPKKIAQMKTNQLVKIDYRKMRGQNILLCVKRELYKEWHINMCV